MAQGPVFVLAQEAAEPADALAADDVIGVDPLVQVGHVGDVPADDDRGVRLILPDQLAHLLDFQHVRDDRRNADRRRIAACESLRRSGRAWGSPAACRGLRCSPGSSSVPNCGGTSAARTPLASASPGYGKAPSGSSAGCRTRRPGRRGRRRSKAAPLAAIRPDAWRAKNDGKARSGVWRAITVADSKVALDSSLIMVL